MDDEKFWSYVNKTSRCWYWTGPRHPKGYGIFFGSQETYTAHYYAYGWLDHSSERTAILLQTCHNRLCCNPNHVSEGWTIRVIADNLEIEYTTVLALAKILSIGPNEILEGSGIIEADEFRTVAEQHVLLSYARRIAKYVSGISEPVSRKSAEEYFLQMLRIYRADGESLPDLCGE